MRAVKIAVCAVVRADKLVDLLLAKRAEPVAVDGTGDHVRRRVVHEDDPLIRAAALRPELLGIAVEIRAGFVGDADADRRAGVLTDRLTELLQNGHVFGGDMAGLVDDTALPRGHGRD